jgi:predicted metal-dependent hydrolase
MGGLVIKTESMLVSTLALQARISYNHTMDAKIKRVEVSVTIDDKKITLEGPEDFVREEIERFVRTSEAAPSVSTKAVTERQESSRPQTERQLIEKKHPDGHGEIVAVLAMHLRDQGVGEFTADDIRRAYLRANVRPPKVVAQALRDAKNKYDYIELGSSQGRYRLSAHGERTVLFDLPRLKEK